MTNDETDERLRAVERLADHALAGLSAHEELCAVRYANINDSIGGINKTIRWSAATLLTAMGGILIKLLFFPS